MLAGDEQICSAANDKVYFLRVVVTELRVYTMDVSPPVTILGQILPNGVLQLPHALDLPPGPVRVLIEPAPVAGEPSASPRKVIARQPGPMLLDECISAPYDLPRPPGRKVQPVRLVERLPEPHDFEDGGE